MAILDPPLQAAAYLRLLQRLPSRSARGLCVIYVAPLEFIDVKNLMALVPGGKVRRWITVFGMHPDTCSGCCGCGCADGSRMYGKSYAEPFLTWHLRQEMNCCNPRCTALWLYSEKLHFAQTPNML